MWDNFLVNMFNKSYMDVLKIRNDPFIRTIFGLPGCETSHLAGDLLQHNLLCF